jgi:hypothetical protein
MQLSQMVNLVNLYIDDVEDTDTIISLLNRGKDLMAVEVNCEFPDVVKSSDMTDTFVFDSKYHEIPVYYAAAMFKSKDSAVREKESYMSQFSDGIRNFTENYDPPVQYLRTSNVQQFTATAGQTDFTITKNDYSYPYGNLKVYVNGQLASFEFGDVPTIFTLETAATEGDKVTAQWEINSEYSYAPAFYPSWG